MHPEEYLDLVDKNDQVIDRKLRSEIYAEGLTNIRFVNVFLRNARGELWIPRRTTDKATFPLCLDFSAAGHVESGETYDETFVREVAEELRIDADTVPHKLLGYLTPAKDGVHQFMKVYEIISDETPAYNPEDFVESYWLTPEDVVARITAGDSAKEDLPILITRFYLAW